MYCQTCGENIERRNKLTPREKDMVHGVLQGWTNKEIANHIEVEPGSVKMYLHKLYEKTGYRTRTRLAVAVTTGEFKIHAC